MRAAYYGYKALSHKWSRGLILSRSLLYIGFLNSLSFVTTEKIQDKFHVYYDAPYIKYTECDRYKSLVYLAAGYNQSEA